MRHGNNNWKVFWVAFRMTSLIILYLIFPLHHSLMSLSSWPIASYKLSNTGQTFHHFSSPGDIVPSPKLSLPPFPLLVNKNRHWPVFLLFFFFSPVAPNRPRIKTQSNRRGLSLGPGGGGGGGGGGWSLLVIWRRFKHSHPPPSETSSRRRTSANRRNNFLVTSSEHCTLLLLLLPGLFISTSLSPPSLQVPPLAPVLPLLFEPLA